MDNVSFWDLNGYKLVLDELKSGQASCDDFVRMIAERAEIELRYTRSLQHWRDKWTHAVRRGREIGSVRPAWIACLQEALVVTRTHEKCAQGITGPTGPRQKMIEWTETHYKRPPPESVDVIKDLEEQFTLASSEFRKTISKIEHARESYHKVCLETYKAQRFAASENHRKGVNAPTKHRLLDRADKLVFQKSYIKRVYKRRIAEIRGDIKQRYIQNMRPIYAKCQELEYTRLVMLRDQMYNFMNTVQSSLPCASCKSLSNHMLTIDSSNPYTDTEQWAKKFGLSDRISLPEFEEFDPTKAEVEVQEQVKGHSESMKRASIFSFSFFKKNVEEDDKKIDVDVSEDDVTGDAESSSSVSSGSDVSSASTSTSSSVTSLTESTYSDITSTSIAPSEQEVLDRIERLSQQKLQTPEEHDYSSLMTSDNVANGTRNVNQPTHAAIVTGCHGSIVPLSTVSGNPTGVQNKDFIPCQRSSAFVVDESYETARKSSDVHSYPPRIDHDIHMNALNTPETKKSLVEQLDKYKGVSVPEASQTTDGYVTNTTIQPLQTVSTACQTDLCNKNCQLVSIKQTEAYKQETDATNATPFDEGAPISTFPRGRGLNSHGTNLRCQKCHYSHFSNDASNKGYQRTFPVSSIGRKDSSFNKFHKVHGEFDAASQASTFSDLSSRNQSPIPFKAPAQFIDHNSGDLIHKPFTSDACDTHHITTQEPSRRANFTPIHSLSSVITDPFSKSTKGSLNEIHSGRCQSYSSCSSDGYWREARVDCDKVLEAKKITSPSSPCVEGSNHCETFESDRILKRVNPGEIIVAEASDDRALNNPGTGTPTGACSLNEETTLNMCDFETVHNNPCPNTEDQYDLIGSHHSQVTRSEASSSRRDSCNTVSYMETSTDTYSADNDSSILDSQKSQAETFCPESNRKENSPCKQSSFRSFSEEPKVITCKMDSEPSMAATTDSLQIDTKEQQEEQRKNAKGAIAKFFFGKGIPSIISRFEKFQWSDVENSASSDSSKKSSEHLFDAVRSSRQTENPPDNNLMQTLSKRTPTSCSSPGSTSSDIVVQPTMSLRQMCTKIDTRHQAGVVSEQRKCEIQKKQGLKSSREMNNKFANVDAHHVSDITPRGFIQGPFYETYHNTEDLAESWKQHYGQQNERNCRDVFPGNYVDKESESSDSTERFSSVPSSGFVAGGNSRDRLGADTTYLPKVRVPVAQKYTLFMNPTNSQPENNLTLENNLNQKYMSGQRAKTTFRYGPIKQDVVQDSHEGSLIQNTRNILDGGKLRYRGWAHVSPPRSIRNIRNHQKSSESVPLHNEPSESEPQDYVKWFSMKYPEYNIYGNSMWRYLKVKNKTRYHQAISDAMRVMIRIRLVSEEHCRTSVTLQSDSDHICQIAAEKILNHGRSHKKSSPNVVDIPLNESGSSSGDLCKFAAQPLFNGCKQKSCDNMGCTTNILHQLKRAQSSTLDCESETFCKIAAEEILSYKSKQSCSSITAGNFALMNCDKSSEEKRPRAMDGRVNSSLETSGSGSDIWMKNRTSSPEESGSFDTSWIYEGSDDRSTTSSASERADVTSVITNPTGADEQRKISENARKFLRPGEGERLVKALYNFQPANWDELKIGAGEFLVQIGKEYQNGWALGRNERGKGLFPASYVRFVKS